MEDISRKGTSTTSGSTYSIGGAMVSYVPPFGLEFNFDDDENQPSGQISKILSKPGFDISCKLKRGAKPQMNSPSS